MLVLLMTAATGAWARGGNTHRITATISGLGPDQSGTLDVSLPYQPTLGEIYQTITGSSPAGPLSLENAIVTSGNNVVTLGELNGWNTQVSVTAEGAAVVNMEVTMVTLSLGATITISVTPIYTVSLKSGTKDAAKWTATVGSSTTAQTLPVGGLSEDDAVTLNYTGRLRVKKVTATTDAKPVSLDTPLTLKATSDGTIVVSNPKDGMQYSKNGATKTSDGIAEISVQKGDKVAFYGNGTSITSYNGTKITGGTATVRVYGNIMSLVDEEGFATATTLTGNYAFFSLFQDNTMLTDASGLLLPATTLIKECYRKMFDGCNKLTTAPNLPAPEMQLSCYREMFKGCIELTTPPVISAESLANYCYQEMFSGCTKLTATPALNITTLAQGCYKLMFQGCTSLTTIPAELPATTMLIESYSGMFQGCTSLTTAPQLKATTLADYCYNSMFQDCIGLTTAPTLGVTSLADYCYKSMFQGCTSLTTAPQLNAEAMEYQCYQSMFQGCTSLTATPALNAMTLDSNCYNSMFSGCTSLTTVPAQLPATELKASCYASMFQGCTSLTTAPELPATGLRNSCYESMFKDCSSLNAVTCLATSLNVLSCTTDWLSGVAASGTFTKAANADWSSKTGTNGIPSGWTVVDAQ